ncbi:putative Calcineurin like phosphoesterase [Trypanosoma vivax]|uniref:Serine/threonine-protein phosphatase n=1 Tax=Trypanosoma vivax (strain Y486) TaxID=1055687 RepID=G0U3V2_TRYVY|nr:putative serine/threonine protein phosphataase [Trypanosoma vivax]KAH8618840.1 putative Calcineurin like phosphoesterase [Trypanosoma vivax]CCC50192.1 putative serine/threonine protein phosphataase [Trypanosoma vivax Y486]
MPVTQSTSNLDGPRSTPSAKDGALLPDQLVFDAAGLPRAGRIKAHFARGGLLTVESALAIIRRCAAIMRAEANVVTLKGCAVVCGDLHGQFQDLLKIFEVAGQPGEQQYVFLGDYVDRGCFGAEIVLLCMSYKVLFPHRFILLRGNHESRQLTSYFNFKREVESKYSTEVYDEIMSTFDCFPLACVINERFFCVHAGLSPMVSRVEAINNIDRFRETPSCGAMCDLLWSDPMSEQDTNVDEPGASFIFNKKRGCAFLYGHTAVRRFLRENNLYTIVRGHETQTEGYRLYRHTERGVPAIVCVFSASNYCGTYGNTGAVIRLNENIMTIHQYFSDPLPCLQPSGGMSRTMALPPTVATLLDEWTKLSEKDGAQRSRDVFKLRRELGALLISLRGLYNAGGSELAQSDTSPEVINDVRVDAPDHVSEA